MIYRIITNHGNVDTLFNKENADRKFNEYVKYMEEGYSSFVLMTEQKGMYGKEKITKREYRK